MPRRNLKGGWGEHSAVSVRLTREDRQALSLLRRAWGCSASEAIRRALKNSAAFASIHLDNEPGLDGQEPDAPE